MPDMSVRAGTVLGKPNPCGLDPSACAPVEDTDTHSLRATYAVADSIPHLARDTPALQGMASPAADMHTPGVQPGNVDMKRRALACSTSSRPWPPPRGRASVHDVTARGLRLNTKHERPQPLPPAASCRMAADSLAQQYGHVIEVTGGDPEGGNHCGWLHKSYTSPLGLRTLPWQYF